ncbi:DUF6082 family protein [Streptomyces sp. NPDC046832]|uniref:DUF6082 family protein n=1 Tax=Streptomyces sp. NPDC046832 TaxID=3155020 RepID=UPI0033D825D3
MLELAETIYTGEDDVLPGKKRQFLFGRAMYNSIVLAWMSGAMALEDLHGRMRVLMHQPVAWEYWAATHPERASMPRDTDQAQVARLVDEIVEIFDRKTNLMRGGSWASRRRIDRKGAPSRADTPCRG